VIEGLARRQLRGHVGRGAHHLAGARERLRRRLVGRDQLGDPEVEQLHEVGVVLALDQEDVARLQVAVDHPALVRRRQRPAHLGDDRPRPRPRHRPLAPEQLLQVLPAQPLHHVEALARVAHADVEALDHVLVLDAGGHPRLATEAFDQRRPGDRLGPQDLDRHLAPDLEVLARVHRPHAAAADLRHHAVASGQHHAAEVALDCHVNPPSIAYPPRIGNRAQASHVASGALARGDRGADDMHRPHAAARAPSSRDHRRSTRPPDLDPSREAIRHPPPHVATAGPAAPPHALAARARQPPPPGRCSPA
jgi:hypothetical protein